MYIFLPIWTHSKVMCHSARFLTYSKKNRVIYASFFHDENTETDWGDKF